MFVGILQQIYLFPLGAGFGTSSQLLATVAGGIYEPILSPTLSINAYSIVRL